MNLIEFNEKIYSQTSFWLSKLFEDFGVKIIIGLELEVYLKGKSNFDKIDISSINMRFEEATNLECKFESERGHNQFELVVRHCDLAKNIDNIIKIKSLVKNVLNIDHRDLIAIFNAKPNESLPGSSIQLNISFTNSTIQDQGFNLKHAKIIAAGLLYFMPFDFPILCPSLSSYKRINNGDKMFTPQCFSWSINDRRAGVRIVNNKSSGVTYVEHRVTSSETNILSLIYTAVRSIYWSLRCNFSLPEIYSDENCQINLFPSRIKLALELSESHGEKINIQQFDSIDLIKEDQKNHKNSLGEQGGKWKNIVRNRF